MANNKPRSTDYFDQGAEGRFDPVVETPKSRFVPIENVPSGDLNPEEICILCEQLKRVTDPELAEAVKELLATHSSHPVPPKEEDANEFPPLGSDCILVARIKESGAEVKPHRNGSSFATIGVLSMLLGLGDYEVYILELDEE